MNKYTCLYCRNWMKSPIIKRSEISVAKNKVVKEIVRLCIAKNKQISHNNESCLRFRPCKYFACETNGIRIDPYVCMHRHNKSLLSKESRKLYTECKKCRQFNKIIYPMCNEFNIFPPMITKLKRRDKPKIVIELKRRDKKESIKIKRRNKPEIIIKRRSEKQIILKRRNR